MLADPQALRARRGAALERGAWRSRARPPSSPRPTAAPGATTAATPGLATSGSGDTLAGVIGGLAARGATLEQACAWGVVLHARAGERLARRLGPVGYLARELAAEMVAVLAALEDAADLTPGGEAPTGK